ncbi:pantoate-beta-alanine ligase [Lucifera butyrica]|uniref:Pantothenate synthetase n=1 Tax=Lucifera butyrica TaxID=1351585 RepID=A0A498R7Y4_9FIRM|nr:pantoate--beta-alanine ligase [Lucifera butyrica]VBB07017.1 pantoate-beta-alanine ligase [Lucifera butyrica]
MLQVLTTVKEMRAYVDRVRGEGKRIGLVPTMGALHAGHLTLMRQAKQVCDVVIASIFVNPTQFGPQEDYEQYPRVPENDRAKAATAGVDVIFQPEAGEIYPAGYATYVEVGGITEKLCGLSRPGHFRGVATVVCKLFHIVRPDRAFFGQKDAQQTLVIRRMARDLHMDVAVDVLPIVREEDGLALSSRNVYLSPQERTAARVLYRSLGTAEAAVREGERNVTKLLGLIQSELARESLARIEYAEIYGYPELNPIQELQDKALVALAVWFGSTRLIDNTILEVAACS